MINWIAERRVRLLLWHRILTVPPTPHLRASRLTPCAFYFIYTTLKVPVGAVWRLLPWNKGRDATCSVENVFVDDLIRVVRDIDGEYFVYSRPVVPRALEI